METKAKTISIGAQSFDILRTKDLFYVDKTEFIREWWYGEDQVTLITRPRRFGKTLNMSMLNCFFSIQYEGRSDLFEGLNVWQDEILQKEQGNWPVLFLSFADVKQDVWTQTKKTLNGILEDAYHSYEWLIQKPDFSDADRALFYRVSEDMDNATAAKSLKRLCGWLERYYRKKVLIFLDEYDTPMQEAWLQGYWNEMAVYIRNLFNSTFKTNPSLGRAILTGITRVSKESIFSDLNNLAVITTTSIRYETAFGFTEEEVFSAMDERGFEERNKLDVKRWYDGFNFGNEMDIYNPWSVTNYMKEPLLRNWWANSSSNALISKLIRLGNNTVKQQFEFLLQGKILKTSVDEEIDFNQLADNPSVLWSLMLASGYLKAIPDSSTDINHGWNKNQDSNDSMLCLTVTNRETMNMLESMVRKWFSAEDYMSPFVQTMLKGDVKKMEKYLNAIMLETIGMFDSGKHASKKRPENFYHGFVLGLIAENMGSYHVWSNRESGLGRYDVVLEPKTVSDPAVILEFKVSDPSDGENTLEETAARALRQIEEMKYDTELLSRGIPAEHIRKYGIAFKGKRCIVRMP